MVSTCSIKWLYITISEVIFVQYVFHSLFVALTDSPSKVIIVPLTSYISFHVSHIASLDN